MHLFVWSAVASIWSVFFHCPIRFASTCILPPAGGCITQHLHSFFSISSKLIGASLTQLHFDAKMVCAPPTTAHHKLHLRAYLLVCWHQGLVHVDEAEKQVQLAECMSMCQLSTWSTQNDVFLIFSDARASIKCFRPTDRRPTVKMTRGQTNEPCIMAAAQRESHDLDTYSDVILDNKRITLVATCLPRVLGSIKHMDTCASPYNDRRVLELTRRPQLPTCDRKRYAE